jgi:nucleoid-associated protein YgaU
MSDTGKMEHAYLSISEPSTNGSKPGVGAAKRIEFSFNPKEFTIARSAEWKAKTSKKPTMPEFAGSKPAAVTLEMFLDASTGGDVMGDVDKLFACVDPHPKTEKDKPSPPFVSFGWGTQVYLDQAVVKTVSVKFTRFRENGEPIRAIATVTLEKLQPSSAKQNPTSGTLDAQTERIVRSGDTLASIAYSELGSPTMWRIIAEANGIDDTFRIKPGTLLLIPSVESIARRS